MTATSHADRLADAQAIFQRMREEREALRADPNATPHQVADTESRCEIARLRLRVAHLEHERHEAEQARGNAVILSLRALDAQRLVVTVQQDTESGFHALQAEFQKFRTANGEWDTIGEVTTSAEGQALEIR